MTSLDETQLATCFLYPCQNILCCLGKNLMEILAFLNIYNICRNVLLNSCLKYISQFFVNKIIECYNFSNNRPCYVCKLHHHDLHTHASIKDRL